MRQLETARRLAGRVAMAGVIVGASALVGCGQNPADFTSSQSQTVLIQVQDMSAAPIANVIVKAWIIDVDQPADTRAPIEVGTAPTDARGQVRFSYAAENAPYVCGWEVWSSGGQTMLAHHPPVISDNLSPHGFTVALVP